MERELTSKIFILEEYSSKENMEEHIKEYIYILKEKYPDAIITREFFKGNNILVRVTETENKTNNNKNQGKEREIDDWHIRQRGER